MFTGIVIARGTVRRRSASPSGFGARFEVEAGDEVVSRLAAGSSVAVSGVCLTVVSLAAASFVVDVSPETLERTTLSTLQQGGTVNLEPALRVGDELGGHWVQGHVDTTVTLLSSRPLGEFREDVFSLSEALRPYVAHKGSVTLDGVSLTVSDLRRDRFAVALIPETLRVTTLGSLAPGDLVNCEVDALAKYVERLLAERGSIHR